MEMVSIFDRHDVVDSDLFQKLIGVDALSKFTEDKHPIIDAVQTLINYMDTEQLLDGLELNFVSPSGEFITIALNITDGKLKKTNEVKSIMQCNLINAVKDYRKKHNLTQDKFGKLVGESRSSISKFENGKLNRKLSFLVKVSNLVGVEINLKG